MSVSLCVGKKNKKLPQMSNRSDQVAMEHNVRQLVLVALVAGWFVRAIETRWCYDLVRTQRESP